MKKKEEEIKAKEEVEIAQEKEEQRLQMKQLGLLNTTVYDIKERFKQQF